MAKHIYLKVAGLCLVSFLFIGCAPSQYRQSNYQQSSPVTPGGSRVPPKLESSMELSSSNFRQCNDAMASSPNGVLVFKEVLYRYYYDTNRKGLVESTAKLTATQSNALSALLPEMQRCLKIRTAPLKDYPLITESYNSEYEKLKAIYISLMNKKITIGEANFLKNKIENESSHQFASAFGMYMDSTPQQPQQYQQYSQPQVSQQPSALDEALIRQMQYQNIQNSIQQLTTPKIITPLPSYTNQNQAPFYQAPQQQLTNPSVNCVPNGVGGFRCQ